MSALDKYIVTKKGISTCRRKGTNSGFTLVELLVVIAIIALLMSILMPALRRVKMQAEEIKCKANLQQVGLTIFMFLQDEDFKMPGFNIDKTKTGATQYPGGPHGQGCNRHLWTADGLESSPRLVPNADNDSYWGVSFNSYVKDIDIFGCPAMTQFAEMLANGLVYSYADLAPGVDGKDIIRTAAFGINGYLGGGLNTNSLRAQSDIIVCTDHVEPRNEQTHMANRGDMFAPGLDGTNLTHFRAKPFRDPRATNHHSSRNEHYRGIFRHSIRKGANFQTGGRAGVLWLDGSTGAIEETYGDNIPNRSYDPRGLWLDI